MNGCLRALLLWFLLTPVGLGAEPGDSTDPFEVIAHFDRAAAMALWPGFDATNYPLAVYDGSRTLLLRHPSPPSDFAQLEGRDRVWSFAGRHPAMRWNATAEIGGVATATLLLTIEPGRSPEREASILMHEVFHLFSRPRHPSWRPNELDRYSYPIDDLETFRLALLEEEALARALEATETDAAAAWAATATALRSRRTDRLRPEHRSFETLLELQEGTAVFIERAVLGQTRDAGRLREERGPEGIRWRCYETGAAIAAVLERLRPSWKAELDARPDTTFAELLGAAVKVREAGPATFSHQEQAAIAARAEAGISRLSARRASLAESFAARGPRVVVRLAAEGERFEMNRFDPMAVEVLDRGRSLQAHQLTVVHPRGELSLDNPRFTRGSVDGVIALLVPAGDDPFRQGMREVAVAGFRGEPTINREGDFLTVEAEGLRISFAGARLDDHAGALVITVPPTAADDAHAMDITENREMSPEATLVRVAAARAAALPGGWG